MKCLQEGLVLYLPFDGDVLDDSGEGNDDGTLNGDGVFVEGKYGRALSFDGINDYVDYGNDASLHPSNAITITAWIYPKSINIGTIVAENSPYYLAFGNSQIGQQQHIGSGIFTDQT